MRLFLFLFSIILNFSIYRESADLTFFCNNNKKNSSTENNAMLKCNAIRFPLLDIREQSEFNNWKYVGKLIVIVQLNLLEV